MEDEAHALEPFVDTSRVVEGEQTPGETQLVPQGADRVGLAAGQDRVVAPRDREVLSLRFEEELSLKEIATLVAAPLPTVKARLYRAMARLRTRLLEQGPRKEWA